MDYTQYFQQKTRVQTQQSFYCLKDERPEELHKLIFDIHHDHFDRCAPNDWIYEKIYDAFYDLESGQDELEDITINSDPYNYHLIEWLNNPFAVGICDEIIEEFGEPTKILDLIERAQINASKLIYESVNDFLLKQRGED